MSRLLLPPELAGWIDRALPEVGGASGVEFRLGPRLPFDWLPGDRQRFTAITLWRTVHVRDRGEPIDLAHPRWLELVFHELIHVAQYARLGDLRFPATYLAQIVRHGYWDHPLEREARERAAELLGRYLAEHARSAPT